MEIRKIETPAGRNTDKRIARTGMMFGCRPMAVTESGEAAVAVGTAHNKDGGYEVLLTRRELEKALALMEEYNR